MIRKSFLAIGLLLSFAAAAIFARSWLEKRDDRLRLLAALDAQQQLIAAADQREQLRAVALQSSLEQIAALKRQVQTPEQILSELPKFLPLPAPIQLVQPHPLQQGTGPQAEKGTPFPEPPRPSGNATQATGLPPDFAAQLPAEDLKPLFDFVQDCRVCQTQLAAARSDMIDERAKSAAISKERDAAIKAAKGGSVWARFKHNAKWLAAGAVIGALASHRRP